MKLTQTLTLVTITVIIVVVSIAKYKNNRLATLGDTTDELRGSSSPLIADDTVRQNQITDDTAGQTHTDEGTTAAPIELNVESRIPAVQTIVDSSRPAEEAPSESKDPTITEFTVGDVVYMLPHGLLPILPWKIDMIGVNDTWADAEIKYFKRVAKLEIECHYRRRMGLMSDGGWHVCLIEPYLPQRNNCLVYSFGLNSDWSFDDAVADLFGCEVHSFDPTMFVDDKRGDHITFHRVGLYGNKTEKAIGKRGIISDYPVNTLGNIIDDIGHSERVIDILKFDIEASEWTALPEMLSSGRLQYVKQLAFEMHTGQADLALYTRFMSLQQRLFDAGFRLWHSDWNLRTILASRVREKGYYTTCQELYYLNVKYLRKDKRQDVMAE